MTNLYEQILVEVIRANSHALRRIIIMEEVMGNTCALCLPVGPDSHTAVVNMIASENNINSCMELDAGDFSTAKLMHVVDVMYMIVLYDREYTAHAANDTCLFAVMNVASANDV